MTRKCQYTHQRWISLLVLLLATDLCHGFLPMVSMIKLCDSISGACENRLLVSATVAALDSEWSFQTVLQSNSIFTGESPDELWATDEEVTITLNRRENYVEYPMQKLTEVNNVYAIQIDGVSPIGACPTPQCCPTAGGIYRTALDLAKNATIYDVLTVGNAIRRFTIDVSISQRDTTRIITLTDEILTGTVPGIKASVYNAPTAEPAVFSTVNVVVDRDTLFHRGMAIPNVLFAPTINRIGMTKEAFFETVLQGKICTLGAARTLTPVMLSTPYDQFSSYRNEQPIKYTRNCAWLSAHSNLNTLSGFPLKMSFTCAAQSYVSILIELVPSSYYIRRLYLEPSVVSFLPLLSSDNVVTFEITVYNSAIIGGTLIMENTGCCFHNPTQCGIVLFVTTTTDVASKTSYKTTLFPLVSGVRSGSCTFRFRSLTTVVLETTLNYTITLPPSSACTIDQLWSTVNQACIPENCFLKYGSGSGRTHYNETSGLCGPEPECVGGCEPTESPPIFTWPPFQPPELKCGPHGYVNSASDLCICVDGWETTYSSEGEVLFCASQIQAPVEFIPAAPPHIFDNSEAPSRLGPIFTGIGCAVLAIALIFAIWYIRFRRNGGKPLCIRHGRFVCCGLRSSKRKNSKRVSKGTSSSNKKHSAKKRRHYSSSTSESDSESGHWPTPKKPTPGKRGKGVSKTESSDCEVTTDSDTPHKKARTSSASSSGIYPQVAKSHSKVTVKEEVITAIDEFDQRGLELFLKDVTPTKPEVETHKRAAPGTSSQVKPTEDEKGDYFRLNSAPSTPQLPARSMHQHYIPTYATPIPFPSLEAGPEPDEDPAPAPVVTRPVPPQFRPLPPKPDGSL